MAVIHALWYVLGVLWLQCHPCPSPPYPLFNVFSLHLVLTHSELPSVRWLAYLHGCTKLGQFLPALLSQILKCATSSFKYYRIQRDMLIFIHGYILIKTAFSLEHIGRGNVIYWGGGRLGCAPMAWLTVVETKQTTCPFAFTSGPSGPCSLLYWAS